MDRTAVSGIQFRHRQGTTLWYLPQITGPGAALLDIDGDGQLDILFVQGSGEDDGRSRQPVPPSQVYRNSDGRFEECAAQAGLDVRSYGMGVQVFDHDNDGYPDVAISAYQSPTRLYRNNGDGTFSCLGPGAGIGARSTSWVTSLTEFDYDRDGFLDLYEGSYLEFEWSDWIPNPPFKDEGKGPAQITLMPGRYSGLPNALYHNDGSGHFSVRTKEVGLEDSGQTLGALAVDFDHDGWPDLMTANDGRTSNMVFHNLGGGRFEDISVSSFASEPRGSMGFAVCDFDLDGSPDILVSHWLNAAALYRSVIRRQGARTRVQFLDRGFHQGLTMERPLVGWAIAAMDVNNDSFEDVLQIHGHTSPPAATPRCGTMEAQPAYLYRNQRDGSFKKDLPAGPDDPIARMRVGRGAAFGDLDRDGLWDVALNNNNQPAELWMNRGATNAWIGFVLVGTLSNRDAISARVSLTRKDLRRWKELAAGESYLSCNARQILFGLGTDDSPVKVQVFWPSGRREEFDRLGTRRYHQVVEGTGTPALTPAMGI